MDSQEDHTIEYRIQELLPAGSTHDPEQLNKDDNANKEVKPNTILKTPNLGNLDEIMCMDSGEPPMHRNNNNEVVKEPSATTSKLKRRRILNIDFQKVLREVLPRASKSKALINMKRAISARTVSKNSPLQRRMYFRKRSVNKVRRKIGKVTKQFTRKTTYKRPSKLSVTSGTSGSTDASYTSVSSVLSNFSSCCSNCGKKGTFTGVRM